MPSQSLSLFHSPPPPCVEDVHIFALFLVEPKILLKCKVDKEGQL